jgi:hypothetical protein
MGKRRDDEREDVPTIEQNHSDLRTEVDDKRVVRVRDPSAVGTDDHRLHEVRLVVVRSVDGID